jgi:pyrimidine deaminase RibD-like protein
MTNDPFQLAINISKKSYYKIKIGAVVVYKNKIVGKGYNRVHSTGSPIESDHAEKVALFNTKARYREGSTVYVGRLSSNDQLAMAKPCPKCQTIMRKMGVKYVWYSSCEGWTRIII